MSHTNKDENLVGTFKRDFYLCNLCNLWIILYEEG